MSRRGDLLASDWRPDPGLWPRCLVISSPPSADNLLSIGTVAPSSPRRENCGGNEGKQRRAEVQDRVVAKVFVVVVPSRSELHQHASGSQEGNESPQNHPQEWHLHGRKGVEPFSPLRLGQISSSRRLMQPPSRRTSSSSQRSARPQQVWDTIPKSKKGPFLGHLMRNTNCKTGRWRAHGHCLRGERRDVHAFLAERQLA